MIQKIIMIGVCFVMLVALSYAGDVADADRPKVGYAKMESRFMTADDLGLDLPDTSIVSDTLYTMWIYDKTGSVNPYKFSINIDVNQVGSNTFSGKIYTVWANDTTDFFLVDSAISGTISTFDTAYQVTPNGAPYWRWYWIATDSNYINDFRVNIQGYK